MVAKFPTRAEDGSFTIAARFHSSMSRRPEVAEILSSLIRLREERDGAPAFANEFRDPPIEEWQGDEIVEVVFMGRPGSRLWRDWVVALMQDLKTAAPGLEFEGWIDRVSGQPHRAMRR